MSSFLKNFRGKKVLRLDSQNLMKFVELTSWFKFEQQIWTAKTLMIEYLKELFLEKNHLF